MNKRQKLVQQQFLNNEQAVIRSLEQVYGVALDDINANIAKLMERFDPETGDLPQSVIYQIKHQEMLKKQIEGILDQMQAKQFLTVSDYLDGCYADGFIGSLFDLHGQGIPLTVPINQEAMVRAVQLDSKISQGLYTRLGEDVATLKKRITAQVSRSISTGTSYAFTAKLLAQQTRIGYNNAIRIARTEGHRIQTTAAMDAMERAQERGADVLKQWDATLDGRTRESHSQVDGEIREIDKKFSNGLMYPGDPSGGAAEVVNCRCALLQRARWALDDAELQTLRDRAAYYGLDKADQYEDFKKKYLKATEYLTKSGNSGKIVSGAISGGRNPFGEKAKEHAERYYEAVRKMTNDVETIARNLGLPQEEIQVVKNFIFLDKHDLGNGVMERFSPDYMMAESWQRLIDGSQEPHDITLIRHEILERTFMKNGLSQEEAHIKASEQFNYSKESREYYAKIKKYKAD